MSKVVDLNCLYPPPPATSTIQLVPGYNGVGDINCLRTGFDLQGQNIALAGTFARVSTIATVSITTPSARTTRGWRIADQNFSTEPWVEVWPKEGAISDGDQYGSPYTAARTLDKWSMRFLIKASSPGVNEETFYFRGYSGGTAVTKVNFVHFNDGAGGAGLWQTNRATSTLVTGGTNPGSLAYARVEVQCDNAPGVGEDAENIIVRIYDQDSTTIYCAVKADLASVVIDAIRFGDLETDGVVGRGGTPSWTIAELEVWDNRHGDGTFSDVWTAAGALSLTGTGVPHGATYSIPAGYTTPADTPTAPLKDTFSSQSYGPTSSNVVDIFVPQAAPADPVAGYPLVLFVHGGFGTQGDRADYPVHFRDRILDQGWAFASMDYVLASIFPTASGLKAWGTDDTNDLNTSPGTPGYGRLPSQIVEVKACIDWLQSVASETGSAPLATTSGVSFDASNVLVMGASWGGYLALMAAATQEVDTVITGSALTFTLAENTTYHSRGGVPDPAVVGALGVASPDNFTIARETDLTHNTEGSAQLWPFSPPSGTNRGVAYIAANANYGIAWNDTDVSAGSLTVGSISYVGANWLINNSIPYANIHGTADRLVTIANHEAIKAGLTAGLADFTEFTSPANHDYALDVIPADEVITWMEGAFGLTGGGGGSGLPSIPSIPTIPSLP